MPLRVRSVGTFNAPRTSERADGSGARGPPLTGVIQTCIMGGVTRLELPAAHVPGLLSTDDFPVADTKIGVKVPLRQASAGLGKVRGSGTPRHEIHGSG